MKCLKCGSVMKESDRCCLKCGAINYLNPLNADYVKKYGDRHEYKEATTFDFKKRNSRRKKLLFLGVILLIIIIVLLISYFLK